MLHTVTWTIHMHWHVRNVFFWIGVLHCIWELYHNSKCLPGVIRLKPIKIVLWIFGTTVDLLHDGLGIGSSILQWELILTNFICKMNFQPVKTIFA
jgi:hypothetical protein